jgi:hypothetical protein
MMLRMKFDTGGAAAGVEDCLEDCGDGVLGGFDIGDSAKGVRAF